MVPVNLVDRAERELLEAQLIDTFLSELHEFRTLGPFASSHPLIIAWDEDVIAHEWHEKYSLGETKVLGALACRVTSDAKGVGCAACHCGSNVTKPLLHIVMNSLW